MQVSYNIDNEKPNESCGIVGIYSLDQDISQLTYLGIYSLQHRGQESAGIACSDGQKISLHKDLGLVNQVFKEENLIKKYSNYESRTIFIAFIFQLLIFIVIQFFEISATSLEVKKSMRPKK